MRKIRTLLLCFNLLVIKTMLNAQAPPSATVSVKVSVPNSMKAAPFNTDRFLRVPVNFSVSVFARISGARFMAVAPNGNILVSVPGEGKVKIVKTSTMGDPVITDFVSGLNRPHDIVFHKINEITYVYIAEQNQINRYAYTLGDETGKSREIVVKNLPDASLPELRGAYNHALKNIALDNNHKLYVSIASTCNACLSDTKSDPIRGAIYIYNADGSNGRLFAQGIRNAEGLAFVPGTNDLWVAVNNRDNMIYPYDDNTGNYGKTLQWFVDNNPPEEFTKVRDGGNYGWPFCNPDQRTGMDNMPFSNDYEFNRNGAVTDCGKMDRISKGIQAHSAPLGLTFLQDTKFPDLYKNGAVIGLHGSWNRDKKTGYKVIYFPWNTATQMPGEQIDLVSGFLSSDSSSSFGRPVDVAVTLQGDLLISDDQNGAIYKLTYTGQVTSSIEAEIEHSIQISPVPANEELYVNFNSPQNENIEIALVNIYSGEQKKENRLVNVGANNLKIDIGSLCPGMYFLNVSAANVQVTRKVMIQK